MLSVDEQDGNVSSRKEDLNLMHGRQGSWGIFEGKVNRNSGSVQRIDGAVPGDGRRKDWRVAGMRWVLSEDLSSCHGSFVLLTLVFR